MSFRNYEVVAGSLLWIAPDGHIQIISVQDRPETKYAMSFVPSSLQEKKNVEQFLKEYVSWEMLVDLDVLSKSGSPNGFMELYKSSLARYDAKSRGMFNFSVELK